MTQPKLLSHTYKMSITAYDAAIFSCAFFNFIIKNLVIICDKNMSIFANNYELKGVKNAQTISA